MLTNIPISIIRSAQRKRSISISVSSDGQVTVRAPKNARPETIHQVLAEREAWIRKQLAKIPLITNLPRIADNAPWRFLDEERHLSIIHSLVVIKPSLSVTSERLVLIMPHDYNDQKIKEKGTHLIKNWYKKRGLKVITERVDRYAQRLGVRYQDIRLKSVTTRWGSCSRRGNLNFNWRILMAPSSVANYVIIHEACHLVHLNHSKRFWNEVARLDPEYKQHRRWLKEHGRELNF
jgi:predicted metal-dependent hydrolase